MTEQELYQQYLKETGAAKKPSDNDLYAQYLAETGQSKQATEPTTSAPEAALSAFGQQATLGYLPQIQAATEPIIQKALGYFLPEDPRGFTVQEAPSPDYTQRRDVAIREQQRMAEEQPMATMAGGLAGGLSTGIATGGLFGTAGRAATFGGRLAQGAKAGALTGLIRNPGDTEGEISPIQPMERLQTSGADAITGALFQGALEGVGVAGRSLKGAGGKLAQYGEDKILKAIGTSKRQNISIDDRGKASEIAQTAINEGLIKVGDDIADIAKKSEAAQSESIKRLGGIYEKADKALEDSIGPIDFKPSVVGIVENRKKDIVQKYADHIDGEEIIGEVGEYLNKLESKKDLTFGQLRKLRQSIDSKIKWTKINGKDEFQNELKILRGDIQSEIGDRLAALNPELGTQFKAENKKLSNLIEIADISDAKKAAEKANASFGLRERMAGGVGAIVGGGIGAGISGPVGAAVGAGVGAGLNAITTKAARQYGTPFVAITANKIAKKLQENPQALGKFSQPLIDASSISPGEFVKTVNLMMKEPDFKKTLEEKPRKFQRTNR